MIHEIQKQMVLQSPLLMEKVKVYRNSIVAKDGSFIQARSADADTAHGYNAHAVLFDELHSQPNRELYDVMKTASGARRQPLFFSISTAGSNKESICYEVYDYAKKVQARNYRRSDLLPAYLRSSSPTTIYLARRPGARLTPATA